MYVEVSNARIAKNLTEKEGNEMSTGLFRMMALVGGILLLSMSMLGQPALAGKWSDTPSGLDLQITKVIIQFEDGENPTTTLAIYGQNFDNGDPPVVNLGDMTVSYTTYTPTEIVATLALSAISYDDYLLSIKTGQSVHQYDEYSLTIREETDPVFSAWDKSTGISITESQITDLDHFTNADETDPVFRAHAASGVTATKLNNWDTAYGWGDHSTVGYLTSYTETDPVFSAWDKSTGILITESQISDLDHFTTSDEIDPTVLASVKDGVDWTEVTGIPAGFGDNTDDGITSETDPTFTASAASGIAAGDITNWDEAYGWGDHALAAYLTSYTETDPVFGAWDKSEGISITESQITDLDHFTSADETDPVYSVAPASGILAGDITNWNTAHGWGDHSIVGYLTSLPGNVMVEGENVSLLNNDAGYLTSYTETDPLFDVSAAKGIASTDISNWTTAYGWGDHDAVGYLTSFTETDPVFGAWDKSTGISITEGQISNLKHFTNADETDPTVNLAKLKTLVRDDFHNLGGTDDTLSETQVDTYVANNGYLTSETDPTVPTSVKDGVSWAELSGKPVGFADDIDNVGITTESDPQVGSNTTNYLPKWDGSALVTGTIYDDGNVGVGTTSPDYKLHVMDRAKFDGANAGLWVEAGTNDWFIGRSGGNLRFYNAGDRVTIQQNGNVSIGYDLMIGGNICLYGGWLYKGIYTVFSTAILWSDLNLKKDVNKINNALQKIKALNGKSFYWNDTFKELSNQDIDKYQKSPLQNATEKDHEEYRNKKKQENLEALSKKEYGFVAQEVEKIFPDWIIEDKDGYKQINTTGLNSILVEAIKELDDKVEQLKQENAEFKARLEALEAQ